MQRGYHMLIPAKGMTFLLTILLLAGGRLSVAAQEGAFHVSRLQNLGVESRDALSN